MTAELEPHDAQTFHRAAVRAGIAERLFKPRSQFEGFGWYDSIPRITHITAHVTTADVTQRLKRHHPHRRAKQITHHSSRRHHPALFLRSPLRNA